MRKLLIILIGILFLTGCVTLPSAAIEHEAWLNIHDDFYSKVEPTGYYGPIEIIIDPAFNYGDEVYLVIRFGGLKPDEHNVVRWTVTLEIMCNMSFYGCLSDSFALDLNDPDVTRDEYKNTVPLTMDPDLRDGLYTIAIIIKDDASTAVDVESVEFTLLPWEKCPYDY